MTLKDKINTAQSFVSILAIFVGAWWTYDNFIKERRHFPHAYIEHNISHIPLTPDINLLRMSLKVTNSGASRMQIVKSTMRIQQILPMLPCDELTPPCVKEQIDIAIQEITRQADRFAWPMIGERKNFLEPPLVDIEPGETEYMDFEFAISSNVRAIRAYSYIRNENKTDGAHESGWHMSSFYELPPQRNEYD